jgi:hypothetical protein
MGIVAVVGELQAPGAGSHRRRYSDMHTSDRQKGYVGAWSHGRANLSQEHVGCGLHNAPGTQTCLEHAGMALYHT